MPAPIWSTYFRILWPETGLADEESGWWRGDVYHVDIPHLEALKPGTSQQLCHTRKNDRVFSLDGKSPQEGSGACFYDSCGWWHSCVVGFMWNDEYCIQNHSYSTLEPYLPHFHFHPKFNCIYVKSLLWGLLVRTLLMLIVVLVWPELTACVNTVS